jgi:hypothetical protein
VHQRQGGWRQFGETTHRGACLWGQAGGREHVLGKQGRADQLAADQSLALAHRSKQVATQQSAGGVIVVNARVPGVRDVRCGEVAEPMGADIDHVPAVERPRRAVGEIINIDLATDPPMCDLGGGAAARNRFIEPHSSASR